MGGLSPPEEDSPSIKRDRLGEWALLAVIGLLDWGFGFLFLGVVGGVIFLGVVCRLEDGCAHVLAEGELSGLSANFFCLGGEVPPGPATDGAPAGACFLVGFRLATVAQEDAVDGGPCSVCGGSCITGLGRRLRGHW